MHSQQAQSNRKCHQSYEAEKHILDGKKKTLTLCYLLRFNLSVLVQICFPRLKVNRSLTCPNSCPTVSDGYAFSQDENGVVSQSEVIRAYDTTKQRTSEW